MSFPQPIKQEIEEIIDLSLREEALCIWDRNVRKHLFRDFKLDQLLNLDRLMKEYVKSLQEESSSFEDRNELRIKIRSHMHNFYLFQVWYKFCCTDQYLDNMEDILKEYCELEVVMYNRIQRKAPRLNSVLNHEIKMRCNRILNLCNLYLLSRLDRVLHVFIKVIMNPRAKPCKEIWAEIYSKFLKTQPKDISDEAFCRAYIIYQRYKEFVDEKEQRILLEMLYCHYERTPDTIERNPVLKKILKPQTNSTLEAISHLAGQLTLIGNQYFEHMRNKSKLDFSEEITDVCGPEVKLDVFAQSEKSTFRSGEVIEIPDDEQDAIVISDDDSDVEIVTPCSRALDEISTFLESLGPIDKSTAVTVKDVPVKSVNTCEYFHSQPTPPTEEHNANISEVDTVYAPQAADKCHEDLTDSGDEKNSDDTNTEPNILPNTKKKDQGNCEQYYSDLESVSEDIDIEEHHLSNSSVCNGRSHDFPNGKFTNLLFGETVNGRKAKSPPIQAKILHSVKTNIRVHTETEFDRFQESILSNCGRSLTPNESPPYEDLNAEDVRPHFEAPKEYSRLSHKYMDKVRGFLCHNSEIDKKWMVDAYNCPMKNLVEVRKKEEERKKRTLDRLRARKNVLSNAALICINYSSGKIDNGADSKLVSALRKRGTVSSHPDVADSRLPPDKRKRNLTPSPVTSQSSGNNRKRKKVMFNSQVEIHKFRPNGCD